MKKFIFLITLSLLSILIIGCKEKKTDEDDDKDPVDENITLEEITKYLDDTKKAYSRSSNVNIEMNVSLNDQNSKIVFMYNLNGFKIDGLKYYFNNNGVVNESFIKQNVEYSNYNGEKTQKQLTTELESDIITKYNFSTITSSFLSNFDKSLMNSLIVIEDKDNVVKLTWDKENYHFIGVSAESTEFDRYLRISETYKSLEVSITYENKLVKSLTSTWTDKEGNTKILAINFKGSDTQVIEYPNDLSLYIQR